MVNAINANKIDIIESFAFVYSNIRVYNRLTEINFISDFRYYESYFMALQTMNQSLGKLYKAYYDKIPFSDYDLPKIESSNTIISDFLKQYFLLRLSK